MSKQNPIYRSVLFIDAGVADAAALTAGVADDVLVVKLVSWRDGVEQIAGVLRNYQGLDSIQIVSHGAAGQLQLGKAVLDSAHLQDYTAALQEWGAALRPGGDLLLYGCDVAEGETGAAFVDALSALSGADVAASTDITGLHGDWDLEYSHGTVEAASAISAAAQQAYGADLALVNGGANGTLTFNTSSNVTLLNSTGLAAGAVVHANNILGTGFDIYAQSSNGGGITIVNANGNSLIGLPLTDDRLTINGSFLSPASYVDLRANSGVFDMVSMNLGSGNLVGNLLGTTVFTVYALDSNYQPTGVGVSLVGLVINEYGLLNFASMADFKGIYGVRIVNPLGFEIAIDDVTVANSRVANTITSAAYNANTGVLNLTAVGIRAGDAIDPSKLTITGANGGTYTLTSPVVSASSTTAASITLNAADKLAINGLLNNNGSSSVDGTTFNIAAAANWDSNLSNGADLTGNAITVSSVQLPAITSASYNAATHVLTVTGTNLVGIGGSSNDITVAKLTIKGEGNATRVLSTSGNVDVTSATSFSVTLSGADIAAVEALLNKNGTTAAGGATYQLSAADDWNSVIGNTNTAVSGVSVAVTNTANSAPTITGAAAGAVNDNATIKPFSGVAVADVNGDNVSMAISFNGANGTLSGTGLSGSNGSYTLSAATPAALTAQLKALTFTPTANQAAVGVGISTTFTLTATDSNGLASTANSSTVITSTSVNDAPVLSGTAAAQTMTAGATLHPFSSVTLSDPDVGAAVIVTITPDSAAKGAFTPASLSASGFVTSDGGVSYTLSSVAPGAAQAALQALVFQSTAGLSATTTFTVSINDGSVIVSNSATTVVSATPSGTVATSVSFSADTGISNSDLITKTAAQTISGALSAGLASGESVEVSLDNGSTWTTANASVGSTSWSLSGQTLSGSGTLQVRVTNAGGSSTPLSTAYTFDTTAPTTTGTGVTFSADTGVAGDLITKTAAQSTITGSLSTALLPDEHVEVSLNNGTTWVTASASGTTWTLSNQTLSSSNTLQVRVVDAAGNIGASTGTAYVLDTTAPTVSLSSNVSALKSGEAAIITLTFSEIPDTSTLSISDFTATGGTLGATINATANPRVFTVEFTPNAGVSGLLGSVSLAAGSYTDLAGNNGGGATSGVITINTLGPSVLITSDAATLKTGETANITFTFSSPPSGFAAGDIVATGGTISSLTNLGGGVYSALFTPGTNVSAAASITVTGGSYTDSFGNQGGSGVTPVILVDTRAPTLAITSNMSAVKDGDTATITFTFSEAPIGFVAGDVSTSGGTLSGLTVTANPLVYTAQFTPNSGVASGTASITVASGAYTDLAGNNGTAGTSPSISIDTLAPATTGTGVSFSNDTGISNSDLVTRTASQTLTGTLSASLLAGEVVQVSLDHGTTWVNATAGSGASANTWSLSGRTLTASDTVQVRVNDAAGNHGTVFSTAYTFDNTAPTVTVTSDLGALRAGQTATLTFSFSEAPYNFSASSLTVSGGTVSGLAATADPKIYTAIFTPSASQSGVTATAQVKANGYIDAAGNSGQASAVVPITINTTLPTLLITSNDVALKAGETATLTFTFSTPPTGFAAADINYSNGTLSGFTATANPLVYTAVFTPDANLSSGAANISVGAGTYTDAFGNSGGGASAPAISIDTLAPTVTITSNVSAVKAGETASVTFTFSEVPLGFTAADVVTTGGVLSGLTVSAGNPLVYTATFTPTAGIQNTSASITVASGAFTDAAGNAATAALTPPISIDTLPPVAVANSVIFSADNGSSSTDLVTNASGQTISGTLAGVLGAGEYVEVSLDNGVSWNTATSGAGAWSLSGQSLSGSDTLKVRVSDGAGNHGTAYSVSYVFDTTAPTVSISSNVSAVKAGETATITFTFSEAPADFTLGDISAANGTVSNLAATANPLVYTATYTPLAGQNGVTDTVAVAAGSYTDKAGNAGAGGSSPGISVDTVAPSTTGASVVFSNDSGATDLITNAAAQDLSGKLSAVLQTGETVEISLNNGSTWITASGTVGTDDWSLNGQTLSSGAGRTVQVRVSDAAGNHGAAFSAGYTLDTTAPTLVISSSKSVLNSADTPTITFTFSEAPVGFSDASVNVSGGTLSPLVQSLTNPLVYTAVFTPIAGQVAGVAAISVSPGAYTDTAANAGFGAAVAAITYATVAPGVSILSDVTALKAGDTANITFKFSTAPTGFALGDVVVGGGALSNFTATSDPLIYTAVFTASTGVANGSGTISVASGTFTDSLGNPGVGGVMAALSIDTLAPTLSITSNVSSLNSTGTALITFTFSEAPAAFSLGDISATNGTLSGLVQTANPLVYTAVLTPAQGVASGSAVVSVAAGAYADLAGNSGGGSNSPAISVDTLAPALAGSGVTFSADTGSSNTDLITRTAAQNIVGTLGGGVLAAGDVVQVSFNNGSTWVNANAPAGGSAWSLSGQTLTSTGTLLVRVTDSNGNQGTVSTYNYVLDTTAPTVSISSDTASLKGGQSATLTFTFSEPPAGFAFGDLIATGGTLGAITATGNPSVFTVVFTPTPGFNGSASVTLGNGLYQDAAGNNGSGASAPGISIDTLAPTLSITSNASALKAGETATITFTFSDAPASFALGDIGATNGTLSALTPTANPLVYTATFTPTAGTASGNAVISVLGSVYADAAGNNGANVSSAPIAVDTLAPLVSGNAVSFSADHGFSSSDLVTNATTQIITGTLDMALVSGEQVQVSLNNGSTWLNAVSTSTTSWALTPQSLSGSGALQVRVVDAAGNAGPVFSAGYVLDLVAPTMVVTSSASALKAGESATLTFTFSEAPTGFQQSDLVEINGTISSFGVTSNPLVYTAQFTPSSSLGSGTAGVTLAAGLYTDLAGNAGAAAASPLISIDMTQPQLTIASSSANLKIGESAVITFTFSELPLGFTLGDINVAGGSLSGFGQTANPLVYTALFTPTAGVGSGVATVGAAAGSFADAAGNAGQLASGATINYSTLAPTTVGNGVVFSVDTGTSGTDLVTNFAGQSISGTLNAALLSGESVEVSLDNGATWLPTTSAGTAWALPGVTVLSGSGILQVRVTDTAGNHGAATSTPYVLDTTNTGVSVSSNVANLKSGESATLTFTFTEAPKNFDLTSLAVVGSAGTLSTPVATANPLVYTAVFTPNINQSSATTVSVLAGSYTDLAGNLGLGLTGPTINVDTAPPSVVITSSSNTLKIGETALITFNFTEAPLGFAVGDITVGGGTLSGFTMVSPLVYSAVFTPTPGVAGASAAISIAPNVYSDAAGNGGLGATPPSISFDTLAPLAAAIGVPAFSSDTGSSGTDLITTAASQTVTGRLSQSLAAGESVQVSFDDGATWNPAAVSGIDWNIAHILTGSGVLRVRVVDAAGNHSADSVHAYVLDQSVPTVTITSNMATANGVTPAVLTLVFSEPPVGFDASMIHVTGGTLGTLTPTSDPKVYTITFAPSGGVASGSATVTVSGPYTDAAGNNGSSASIPSLQIDTVAPTATAGGVGFTTDTGVGGDLITNVATQTLSGNLSAPLAAGDIVQISLDNGVSWETVATSIGDTSWSIAKTLSGSSTLHVRVLDAAGNFSTAYTAPYTIDTSAPTVTMSSSGGTVGQGSSAVITLTLSDAATLHASDLVVTGGTITGFSGSGTTYTVTITPPANSTTPITVNIGGGVFTDTAGNGSAAAAPLVVQVNTNTPVTPGTPSTVDGVQIHTFDSVDPATGLATRLVTVPIITASRPEDTSTSHALLADIPIGLAPNAQGRGTSLVVSLPVGVGFEASGPSVLLSGETALTDLIGRIDDHTASGQATRAAMEAQARQFLDSLDPGTGLQHATLTMSADGAAAAAWVMVNGGEVAATGGSNVQHDAQQGSDDTAVALVIDARALPQGIGLQLDDLDFAAIIGAATVQGGAGKNFFIGDGEAQRMVLGTGADNDTLYGNGGDDVLATAAGNDYLDGGDGRDTMAGGAGNDVLNGGADNDVLQGGRSDAGQWQFYLKDGKVVGQHQLALAGATVMETVTAAELNGSVAALAFAGASASHLQTLSLLYHAAFDRAPDLPGLNFWALHGIADAKQLAQAFIAQTEADQHGLATLSNHDFVALLLENTLGTPPDAAALAPWIAKLDAAPGDASVRAGVLADIALSAAHQAAWLSADGFALGGQLLAQEQGWIANSGDDRLQGGAGADRLVGGDGTDTVVYSGAAASYNLALNRVGEVLLGESGGAQDTVLQIERGEFKDATLDLSFTQASAASLQEIGMLYHLTLGRAGDFSGFKFWADSGLHGSALAAAFVNSTEFVATYGGMSDASFINQLYLNTLQQGAPADILNQWDVYLDSHSRSDLVSLLTSDATLVGSQYGANGMSLIGSL
ncbi:DUF4347 domain-containing protein [Pseudoduganella sp. FT55W]|uniref:DUF4347 domain-containing protein n=1 Tax=Duganella rivi TaxID=2666083 RepID=A0A7X4GUG6_9BURK|nr:Ig-like domain-containing protein [Duganella rivi]MYM69365.1 DUF4347 domain-containing protein [Duganella rivi]